MAAYADPDRAAGRAAADKAITTARTCPVPEINRLGRTLTAWRTEFLARFDQPSVSNGPTECLNLKIKNTKRTARGYRSFANYRLRLLLNHGLIREDQQTTRIRSRPTQQDCVESRIGSAWSCWSCWAGDRRRPLRIRPSQGRVAVHVDQRTDVPADSIADSSGCASPRSR